MNIRHVIFAAAIGTSLGLFSPVAPLPAFALAPSLQSFVGGAPAQFDSADAAVSAFKDTLAKGDLPALAALLGLDAGKAHNAGRVALGSEDHLPRTVGVCDVGQPQIRGGHSQREHETRSHDAERQHTG